MKDDKARAISTLVSDLHNSLHIEAANLRAIIERSLEAYDLVETAPNAAGSNLKANIEYYINVRKLDGLAKRSLHRYEEELNLFARYIDKSVAAITITDIRMYFAEIQSKRHLEKTTLNNKISIVRNFFTFLYTEELIPKNPSAKMKNLKVDLKGLRDSLTAEELEILREACTTIREKAVVEFLFSTGCRVSEAVETKVAAINWIENSLIVHGKGDKNRIVFFSVKCKLYLKQYLMLRKGQSDYLFVGERLPHRAIKASGLERVISRIAGRTGITSSVSPHVLRHTFATLALSRGMSIDLIQHLLGHCSISTTQIYAETSQKALKSAYEQFMAA